MQCSTQTVVWSTCTAEGLTERQHTIGRPARAGWGTADACLVLALCLPRVCRAGCQGDLREAVPALGAKPPAVAAGATSEHVTAHNPKAWLSDKQQACTDVSQVSAVASSKYQRTCQLQSRSCVPTPPPSPPPVTGARRRPGPCCCGRSAASATDPGAAAAACKHTNKGRRAAGSSTGPISQPHTPGSWAQSSAPERLSTQRRYDQHGVA